MDRSFWTAIKADQFQVPAGHTAQSLLGELMSMLSSPDPELRDALGYEILGTWVAHGGYIAPQLEVMAAQLMANLEVCIGEQETDSVFYRSFSALILAEIVGYDGKNPALPMETLAQILGAAERYVASEQDVRGFVPGKGWAHSVAHTADLLMACARHPHFGTAHLGRILAAIAAKVNSPTGSAYVAGEPERLATAALAVARRRLVPDADFGAWAMSVAKLAQGTDPAEGIVARHDVRSFLTGLYAMLSFYGLPEAKLVGPALSALEPWWYRSER